VEAEHDLLPELSVMSRDDFIAAWSGAGPDMRFDTFLAWIFGRLSGLEDLLPSISIVRDPSETQLRQLSEGYIVVPADYFEDTNADRGLNAGDAIIQLYFNVAMTKLYEKQQEQKRYAEDYKKEQQKKYEKMLKDAKPKGSKAGYGDYLYGKKMKDLEYGSG